MVAASPRGLCPADPGSSAGSAGTSPSRGNAGAKPPRGTAQAPVTGSFPSARRRRQVDFALSGIGSLGLPGEDSNPYNGDQNPASCH